MHFQTNTPSPELIRWLTYFVRAIRIDNCNVANAGASKLGSNLYNTITPAAYRPLNNHNLTSPRSHYLHVDIAPNSSQGSLLSKSDLDNLNEMTRRISQASTLSTSSTTAQRKWLNDLGVVPSIVEATSEGEASDMIKARQAYLADFFAKNPGCKVVSGKQRDTLGKNGKSTVRVTTQGVNGMEVMVEKSFDEATSAEASMAMTSDTSIQRGGSRDRPPTDKQLALLLSIHVTEVPTSFGQASELITAAQLRPKSIVDSGEIATQAQINYLKQLDSQTKRYSDEAFA